MQSKMFCILCNFKFHYCVNKILLLVDIVKQTNPFRNLCDIKIYVNITVSFIFVSSELSQLQSLSKFLYNVPTYPMCVKFSFYLVMVD